MTPLLVMWPRAENVDLETAIAAFLFAETYVDAFGPALQLVRSWAPQDLLPGVQL